MVHKAEKKKTKSIKTPAIMTFKTIICTNEGVDIDDFIKNSTDYLAEPRDDKGCVIVFNLDNYQLSKNSDKKEDWNNAGATTFKKNQQKEKQNV